MLVLITELAETALAVIEPLIVETLVLITELADAALAVISPLRVATLAEMLVLITELADAALAVIEPLIVETLLEISLRMVITFAVMYEFVAKIDALALAYAELACS